MNFADPYIGQPIHSLQTMLRFLSNETPEIPHLIPDGIYGEKTLQAVSAFQRNYQLPVTGVVNDATWQAIFAAYQRALTFIGPAAPLAITLEPNQVINQDSPCIHLWLMQAMLHVISTTVSNLPSIEISGIYDENTTAAVYALQDTCGLSQCARGSVDRITWKYMTHLYRSVTNTNPSSVCDDDTQTT